MRLIIDHPSSSCVESAIEALNSAHIPNEGGATVSDGNADTGLILIAPLYSEEAIDVLRKAGIVVRPG